MSLKEHSFIGCLKHWTIISLFKFFFSYLQDRNFIVGCIFRFKEAILLGLSRDQVFFMLTPTAHHLPICITHGFCHDIHVNRAKTKHLVYLYTISRFV